VVDVTSKEGFLDDVLLKNISRIKIAFENQPIVFNQRKFVHNVLNNSADKSQKRR